MSFGEGNLRIAVAELQARIDELERENATLALRLELQEEETAHQSADYVGEQKRCADLERENEHLKQLASDMLVCLLQPMISMQPCGDCPREETCSQGLLGFRYRAEDLGIEVEQ